MNQTTQGPWRVGLPDHVGVFSADIHLHGLHQSILLADCGSWRRDSHVLDLEEIQANARLMAASPEMRDLLREWRRMPFFEKGDEWRQWVADFGQRVDEILKRIEE